MYSVKGSGQELLPCRFSTTESENAMWMAVLLSPALIVFTIHLLLLGLWQWIDTQRLRRHTNQALLSGNATSLRRAAGEASEAARDWPGEKLWTLQRAAKTMQHRLENPA